MADPPSAGHRKQALDERFQRSRAGTEQPRDFARACATGGDL